ERGEGVAQPGGQHHIVPENGPRPVIVAGDHPARGRTIASGVRFRRQAIARAVRQRMTRITCRITPSWWIDPRKGGLRYHKGAIRHVNAGTSATLTSHQAHGPLQPRLSRRPEQRPRAASPSGVPERRHPVRSWPDGPRLHLLSVITALTGGRRPAQLTR